MLCYFCHDNGIYINAVALAAQDFSNREEDENVYEFYPVCWDHLSTWNNGATERFPAYSIDTLEKMPHGFTYDKRASHN